jgi:hypothetical protein
MGSAVVITIDLCPRRPALCAKCRALSTYGSGQNCSGAIADPPVAPGSASSGSRNCLNARVPLYAITLINRLMCTHFFGGINSLIAPFVK